MILLAYIDSFTTYTADRIVGAQTREIISTLYTLHKKIGTISLNFFEGQNECLDNLYIIFPP